MRGELLEQAEALTRLRQRSPPLFGHFVVFARRPLLRLRNALPLPFRDNEVRVFELGADDFITKPFRARALSARLEAVLGRHRA